MNKWILNFNEYLLEYVDMKHAQRVLPNKKLKHSKRVAELTKLLKDDTDIYSAAVYHDFLERGGEVIDMKEILTPYALELVYLLTNQDEEDTLYKLKSVLSGKSKSTINDILIIKLCDRTDNLKKRVQKNILSKNYINKSTELIQWIWDNYTGDKEKMKIFIEDNILLYIPKINKKIILD
jgi:hypothetical protein